MACVLTRPLALAPSRFQASSRMAPPPIKRPGVPTAAVIRASKEKVEVPKVKAKASSPVRL